MAWRATREEVRETTGPIRKEQLRSRVDARIPVGLLGFDSHAPVAWVSVGPRETFRGLGGPEAAPGEIVWSLTCMFIRRSHRGRGLSQELIRAAAARARSQGGDVLEAYPVTPDSPSYRCMGFVQSFETAGFTHFGMAGTRRHVMRLSLR